MTIRADALEERAIGFRPRRNGSMLAGRAADTSRYTAPASNCWRRRVVSGESAEHAWPSGSLLPNDLGLFDTLGNVDEWCQEGPLLFGPIGQQSTR